jgi:hypothetical protein
MCRGAGGWGRCREDKLTDACGVADHHLLSWLNDLPLNGPEPLPVFLFVHFLER